MDTWAESGSKILLRELKAMFGGDFWVTASGHGPRHNRTDGETDCYYSVFDRPERNKIGILLFRVRVRSNMWSQEATVRDTRRALEDIKAQLAYNEREKNGDLSTLC